MRKLNLMGDRNLMRKIAGERKRIESDKRHVIAKERKKIDMDKGGVVVKVEETWNLSGKGKKTKYLNVKIAAETKQIIKFLAVVNDLTLAETIERVFSTYSGVMRYKL